MSDKAGKPEKAIPRLAGSVGAIAFALGLMIMAFSDQVNIFSLGLSGLGLLLMVVFIILDYQRVREFLTSRSTVYSTNMMIIVLALLGILIIVNAIAANHYVALDLTRGKDNTLSPQTRKILDEITQSKTPIAVTAFIKNDDPQRFELTMLLERFNHFAPGFKFDFADYEIKKKLAMEKEVDRPCILLESDKASKKVYNFDERAITAGILALINPVQKVIGLITGHGELSAATDDNLSISDFTANLEKENYKVKPVDLVASNGVPADVTILLIIAPEKPFNDHEIELLRQYAQRGGAFAVFLEPFAQSNLAGLLNDWGIENPPVMLIDSGDNYFQDETIPMIKNYESHQITSNFIKKQQMPGGNSEGIVMPTATSLALKQPLPGDVEVQPLASTSDKSWGETSSQVMEFDQGQDLPGPLPVAVVGIKHYGEAIAAPVAPNPETTDEEQKTAEDENKPPAKEEAGKVNSRFIVVGDSDLLTNASLKEGANFDFTMNSINWLGQDERMISERPPIAEMKKIELEPGQAKAIQIFNMLLPVLVACVGIVTWLKRR